MGSDDILGAFVEAMENVVRGNLYERIRAYDLESDSELMAVLEKQRLLQEEAAIWGYKAEEIIKKRLAEKRFPQFGEVTP